jgi:dihydroorotate dehydrogenase (NAD+) catalytic subunit
VITASPDLSCLLAGVRLPSPLVLASGILGTHASLLERVARSGAGAVTAKSCGPSPRRGHPNPTAMDWGHGLINAMGLPNPGVEAEVEMLAEARQLLAPLGVALIASIFAETPERFGEVAARIASSRPDFIELNVSCPNVHSDFGEPFAASPDGVTAVTRAVCAATDIPVIVKLSPAVSQIARIAAACQRAGARAICAVNTMPGMVIDAESGSPVLANQEGGVSGPALKPIALRCVHAIAREVDIPIIGTGGVLTGTDAVEMLMAGATVVGVGSALYYRGAEAIGLIRSEMASWLASRGHGSLEAIRGSALRPWPRSRTPTPPPIPGSPPDSGEAP